MPAASRIGLRPDTDPLIHSASWSATASATTRSQNLCKRRSSPSVARPPSSSTLISYGLAIVARPWRGRALHARRSTRPGPLTGPRAPPCREQAHYDPECRARGPVRLPSKVRHFSSAGWRATPISIQPLRYCPYFGQKSDNADKVQGGKPPASDLDQQPDQPHISAARA